jgi:hypothetical protein
MCPLQINYALENIMKETLTAYWKLHSRNRLHYMFHEVKKINTYQMAIHFQKIWIKLDRIYLIPYIRYCTRMWNVIGWTQQYNTNTTYMLCTAVYIQTEIKQYRVLLFRIIYPETIPITIFHVHYAHCCSPLAPFSYSKNRVTSTAFRITAI